MLNDAQIQPHFTEVCLLRAAKEVVVVGLERMKAAGGWEEKVIQENNQHV